MRRALYDTEYFFRKVIDAATFRQCFVWWQQRGTEKRAVAFFRTFLAETLAVRQACLQRFQPHPGNHFVIDVVQVSRIPLMFDLPVVISVSLIMLAYFSELSMMNRSAAIGQKM